MIEILDVYTRGYALSEYISIFYIDITPSLLQAIEIIENSILVIKLYISAKSLNTLSCAKAVRPSQPAFFEKKSLFSNATFCPCIKNYTITQAIHIITNHKSQIIHIILIIKMIMIKL